MDQERDDANGRPGQTLVPETGGGEVRKTWEEVDVLESRDLDRVSPEVATATKKSRVVLKGRFNRREDGDLSCKPRGGGMGSRLHLEVEVGTGAGLICRSDLKAFSLVKVRYPGRRTATASKQRRATTGTTYRAWLHFHTTGDPRRYIRWVPAIHGRYLTSTSKSRSPSQHLSFSPTLGTYLRDLP